MTWCTRLYHLVGGLRPEGRAELGAAGSLAWLPAGLLAFSAVLGSLTGRYLYPFIDLGALGLGTVLRNGALLAVLFWVLGLAEVGIDRALSRAHRAP